MKTKWVILGHPTDDEIEYGGSYRYQEINSLDELEEALKYFKNELNEKHVHLEHRVVDSFGDGISVISQCVIALDGKISAFTTGI